MITDVSAPDSPVRMLFARLQLADPAARSYLIASVRGESPVDSIAEQLRSVIAASGHTVTLVDSPDVEQGLGVAGTAATYEVISAPGVLTDGQTLLLAARADLTVLVVTRGRTVRRELETARRELVSAGATLAAAVLIE